MQHEYLKIEIEHLPKQTLTPKQETIEFILAYSRMMSAKKKNEQKKFLVNVN
jgi:hypothetical protein